MSQNNIWGFGCSFTQGAFTYPLPIKPTHDSKSSYYIVNGVKVTWDERLQTYHHLNTVGQTLSLKTGKVYGVNNYGKGGHGNRSTLYTLLRYIHEFEPGDVVIVGLTYADRQTVVVHDSDVCDDWSQVLSKFKAEDVHNVQKILNCPSDQHQTLINELLYPYRNFTIQELQCIAHEYMTVGVGNPKTLTVEKSYIKKVIGNIKTTLHKIKVKVLIWDNDLWYFKYNTPNNYFENILTWSNGKIKDYHWSPNGNKKAGLLFSWCIENGYDYIDPKVICEFDKSNPDGQFEPLKYKDIQKTP